MRSGLRSSALVEIDTDEGLTGIAEADALGNAAVVKLITETDLKPMLVGQDRPISSASTT